MLKIKQRYGDIGGKDPGQLGTTVEKRNIPSRSSMGPSIVRDDSDEDDIIPVSRSRRTSRSCDLTRKTSPSVDKKLKVRTTSQSQDFSIVQIQFAWQTICCTNGEKKTPKLSYFDTITSWQGFK